jgi:hypothetical protein
LDDDISFGCRASPTRWVSLIAGKLLCKSGF